MPMPDSATYARIADALSQLSDPSDEPSLAQLAAQAGLSEFHFQRQFREWVGVTPKEFAQALKLRRAKQLLAKAGPLLDVALDAGLSGGARLHDLFVRVEKLTPGEFRAGGEGLELRWCLADTWLGRALFVASARGLCRLSFLADRDAAIAELHEVWPRARFVEDAGALAEEVAEIDRRMRGLSPQRSLGVALAGTPLRLQVWEALLRVPSAALVSYSTLAAAVGKPQAVRAVASCVAENPIGWLIPCHRVIRATGAIGEYHWGSTRKQVFIEREALLASAGRA
jgi:AraC family transcriptional regulator of adaptative response/methylated-DNA-[protein]-cysteine methyltransferase